MEGQTSGQRDKYIVVNIVAFHNALVNASGKGIHIKERYFTNTISIQITSRGKKRSGKILATEHVRYPCCNLYSTQNPRRKK
jgi:hypothetical protein